MKVVAINGSPRENGNTYTTLNFMKPFFEDNGIEFEILQIGKQPVANCIGCRKCKEDLNSGCVFKNDVLNNHIDKIINADGVIFGTPVYYAGIAGGMKSYMDRLFYSHSAEFAYKPVAAFCSLRRSGGVETFNQLNNYFSLSKSLIVPTSYWSAFHGQTPGEIVNDIEGMDCAKEIALNMSWLLKVLENSNTPLPNLQPRKMTNFIR